MGSRCNAFCNLQKQFNYTSKLRRNQMTIISTVSLKTFKSWAYLDKQLNVQLIT